MTLTVLCVDDSSDDTLLLRRACRRADVKFVLQSVDDGDKAIAYLSGLEGFSDRTTYPIPTLILLDLKMPTRTGFEVLEWLRKHPQYNNLPVAILTSSHDDSDALEAYSKGANCFLTKPVQYEALIDLAKALDKSFDPEQIFPDPLRQLPVFKPPPATGAGLWCDRTRSDRTHFALNSHRLPAADTLFMRQSQLAKDMLSSDKMNPPRFCGVHSSGPAPAKQGEMQL